MLKRQLSIPAEILCEFIQHDLSPSSLTRWCLVSRSFLEFAGPLLCRDVALTRAQDVVPYLIRLCFAKHHRSRPPLVPGVRRLKRLSISAFPPEDLFKLLKRRSRLDSVDALSLTLIWDPAWKDGGAHEEAMKRMMAGSWAPALLLLLRPTIYTEDSESKQAGVIPRPVLDAYLSFIEDDVVNLISREGQRRIYHETMHAATYTAMSAVARLVRISVRSATRYLALVADLKTQKETCNLESALLTEALQRGARLATQIGAERPAGTTPPATGMDFAESLVSYAERCSPMVTELEQTMDTIGTERNRLLKQRLQSVRKELDALQGPHVCGHTGATQAEEDLSAPQDEEEALSGSETK